MDQKKILDELEAIVYSKKDFFYYAYKKTIHPSDHDSIIRIFEEIIIAINSYREVKEKKDEWQPVNCNNWQDTDRLKVNGGYIYSRRLYHFDSSVREKQNISSSMCFVPDVDLQRYQVHLRDAYTQGYKAGQEDSKRGINEHV